MVQLMDDQAATLINIMVMFNIYMEQTKNPKLQRKPAASCSSLSEPIKMENCKTIEDLQIKTEFPNLTLNTLKEFLDKQPAN